ncbi:MAG TPA: Bax inhibitor-1/YccA family protein [Anaerolineales bacterium]|nr:Bax inhibitor-1/YccA family protein [Anaerolineales bacterium]
MAQQTTTLRAASDVRFNRFLALVYLVMAFGLGVTALVSSWTISNEDLMRRILFDSWFVWGLFILQLIVVGVLSAAVLRMSPAAAFLLFVVYAALTGVSISAIFIYYSQSQVSYAFWMAAGMFLFSSVVGLLIRRDLSGAAQFLMLALMGWIFGYFISWFFPLSSGFNQLVNFSGILLFAGLTVWDTQRLKQLSAQLEGRHGMGGMVVVGALALYLDFINLFLLLLRASRR